MSAETPTALVADSHELFRAGVVALLTRECGFGRVIEAGSLDEALMRLDEHAGIRFACFDLAMPGIGTPLNLRSVREVFPRTRIAVIGGSGRGGGREEIFLALRAGLHGYVPKALGVDEIAAAFRLILAGGIFVPPSLAELPLPSDWAPSYEPSRPVGTEVRLTPRQQDVLRLIRSGKSNKEIARTLGLTENTVKVHANALYRALGVRDRTGAAQRAGQS
ncbi:LuxR C-terminal-related transcriptional regulator [Methylobacterium soli]|uniref:Response regulator transcription factor n=1 Tax=Methylobacterium soli TaxID=553447 RepID=A0A6L3SQR4_9HYPH|nr:response regulator transcription factor [Methylobacterium soli]KAB1072082.1 response regulator transcription factor [Methylobacterium soli]GJE44503.1 Transcriptional regulatory protein DegU [Methylobacterium soli]